MNIVGDFVSPLKVIDEVLTLIYILKLHNKSYCYQLLFLCEVQLDLLS